MKSTCTIGRIDGKSVQTPASDFAEADVSINGTWRSGECFHGGGGDNAAFHVFRELAIEAASPEDEVGAVSSPP